MKTEIYLIRHAEPFKYDALINNDDIKTINEKLVLSIDGESKAYLLSLKDELQDII